MGASHQDLDGGIVQLRFGFELTGLAKGGHGVRIEEEDAGRQRGMRDLVQKAGGKGRPNIRGRALARARFRPEFMLYDWS
jgi:hypothetical protein